MEKKNLLNIKQDSIKKSFLNDYLQRLFTYLMNGEIIQHAPDTIKYIGIIGFIGHELI